MLISPSNPARQLEWSESHDQSRCNISQMLPCCFRNNICLRGRTWSFVPVQIKLKRTIKITSTALSKLSFSSVLLMHVYFYTDSSGTGREEMEDQLTLGGFPCGTSMSMKHRVEHCKSSFMRFVRVPPSTRGKFKPLYS